MTDPETKYTGTRDAIDIAQVSINRPGFAPHALPPRLGLANHSPSGFEWGYGGSGPAQLALALVAHATGDDALALRVYQDFKREVVTAMKRSGFELTAKQIADHARMLDPGAA